MIKISKWFNRLNKFLSCLRRVHNLNDVYQLKKIWKTQGSHGKVYEGEHINSHEQVVIKYIPRKFIHSLEIECLKKFSHPNIVQYIERFETKDGAYIVTEKCEGDLFDLIILKGGRFRTENEVSYIIRQILLGLDYIHQKHIVHCDLKLSNIIYKKENDLIIKIIDFGSSQYINQDQFLEILVGSTSFIAPEVLSGSYNKSCDLWSVGCIVFCMLFGYNPFNPNAQLGRNDVFCNILKGFSPEVKKGYGAFFPDHIYISPSAKHFISNLLVLDWRNRMTIQEALNHPWLKK
jgi:serine/threonine protein kinase